MSEKAENIIRHLVDDNLIDAKLETEGYLNDILSNSIRSKYQEVSPTIFDELETTEEENKESDQLFDQDVNEEEDFEIPAFLRKQKF